MPSPPPTTNPQPPLPARILPCPLRPGVVRPRLVRIERQRAPRRVLGLVVFFRTGDTRRFSRPVGAFALPALAQDRRQLVLEIVTRQFLECGAGTRQQALQILVGHQRQQQVTGTQAFSATTPLSWHDDLAGAANSHTRNMANGNFFVSKMLQKAKIEVSEEGTKAAAVTAAIMTMSALAPDEPRRVDFHADHPFVYVISEAQTGAILFVGQYTGE